MVSCQAVNLVFPVRVGVLELKGEGNEDERFETPNAAYRLG